MSLSPTAIRMRAAKRRVESTREALRDEVCVGPAHPGGPSKYRYVLRESCVPLSAKPKPKPSATPSAKPNGPTEPTVERVERVREEIAQLRRVFEVQYPAGAPKEASPSPVVLQNQFSFMVSPFYRLKYPDPEKRYNAILEAYAKRPKDARYRILLLTLTHLEALVASETSKALPGHLVLPNHITKKKG